MRDRNMRSGTELAQDIQLTDWSRAREHVKNLSNQFSGVQISCDICTSFGRYLYSTKQCWIIKRLIQYSKYPKSHQNKPIFFNAFAIYAILFNKDFNFLKCFDTGGQREHCVQNVI